MNTKNDRGGAKNSPMKFKAVNFEKSHLKYRVGNNGKNDLNNKTIKD